jgi:hypothetical protein
MAVLDPDTETEGWVQTETDPPTIELGKRYTKRTKLRR